MLKRNNISNCGECGDPTCLVFASLAVEGVKDKNDIPPIHHGAFSIPAVLNKRDLLIIISIQKMRNKMEIKVRGPGMSPVKRRRKQSRQQFGPKRFRLPL